MRVGTALAAAVAVLVVMTGQAGAGLLKFNDRETWRLGAGGGTGDLFQNFDGFAVDVPYNVPGGVDAGFLNLSISGGGDSSWRIDAPPDAFGSIPNVNGTAFATTLSAGLTGARTVLTFDPIGGLGFDFGRGENGNRGILTLVTSGGQTVSFDNTNGGGFIGLLLEGSDTFTSLTFTSTTSVFAGIDDVEAFTNPSIVPLPPALPLLGAALLWLGWLKCGSAPSIGRQAGTKSGNP